MKTAKVLVIIILAFLLTGIMLASGILFVHYKSNVDRANKKTGISIFIITADAKARKYDVLKNAGFKNIRVSEDAKKPSRATYEVSDIPNSHDHILFVEGITCDQNNEDNYCSFETSPSVSGISGNIGYERNGKSDIKLNIDGKTASKYSYHGFVRSGRHNTVIFGPSLLRKDSSGQEKQVFIIVFQT